MVGLWSGGVRLEVERRSACGLVAFGWRLSGGRLVVWWRSAGG